MDSPWRLIRKRQPWGQATQMILVSSLMDYLPDSIDLNVMKY
jgi:hypothetical protein